MKIKIPQAYFYSDQPLNYLKDSGFSVQVEDHPDQGCRIARIPLKTSEGQVSGLKFITILDEDLFINKNFSSKRADRSQIQIDPHLDEDDVALMKDQNHDNTATQLLNIVDLESLSNEPWADFLVLRKNPGLAAVVLACSDYEKAKSFGKFHKEFVFESRKYGIIHLGSNSFDILITQT